VFRSNPIYRKEVNTGMTAAKTAVLIIGFNTVLAIVAFTIFYTTISGAKNMESLDYSGLANLYTVMAYIEFCIVALIVPAITAGSIAGERERQTLDVMLSSKVYPSTIVWGKLMSCMQLAVIVCISGLPVLSIVFAYGGIRFTNLIMLLITVICTAFYLGSIGILSSCICKKATTSVVMAYTGLIVTIVVTGGIVYIVSKLSGIIEHAEEAFVANVANIMLLNPAATIVNLVSEQLETTSYFEPLLFNEIVQYNNDFFENWTLYSMVVQLCAGTVIMFISAWILNPLKFGLWRRLKKIYEDRKNKNDVISG